MKEISTLTQKIENEEIHKHEIEKERKKYTKERKRATLYFQPILSSLFFLLFHNFFAIAI